MPSTMFSLEYTIHRNPNFKDVSLTSKDDWKALIHEASKRPQAAVKLIIKEQEPVGVFLPGFKLIANFTQTSRPAVAGESRTAPNKDEDEDDGKNSCSKKKKKEKVSKISFIFVYATLFCHFSSTSLALKRPDRMLSLQGCLRCTDAKIKNAHLQDYAISVQTPQSISISSFFTCEPGLRLL